MGGYFGVTSTTEALLDTYYGADYHSHLGTHAAGIACWDAEIGLQRVIHRITDSPFRTKFADVFSSMKGSAALACLSDGEPQPLLIRSRFGTYALSYVGAVQNKDELAHTYLDHSGSYFNVMTGGEINTVEVLAAIINQADNLAQGVRKAQEEVEGSACILILKDDGNIVAARDILGRLPIFVGKNEQGHAVSFEDFALRKMGYDPVRELGPGEIVEVSPHGITQLHEPGHKMRICAFLWSYYGYPPATYEGATVEDMRNLNGQIMAENDEANGLTPHLDYVGGVPDSGVGHAIGYATRSGVPYARAMVKYTPTWSRSFTPSVQDERNHVAKMKQIPVGSKIEGKDLLFVDDSIVRGTQLHQTVDFLYRHGAKSVHMRSACPPLMYACKYLNFSTEVSDMELIARRVINELEGDEGFEHMDEYADGITERGKALRHTIAERMGFATLEFQSLSGVIKAIGIDPEKLCTYCWTGKE